MVLTYSKHRDIKKEPKEKMTEMIRVERHGEVAVVTLAREPVNTMNMAMWEALLLTLDDLEREKESGTFEGNSQAGGIRGIIFQSGVERDVFTAGNDIMELYAPNTSLERYRYVALHDYLAFMRLHMVFVF